jgi:dipeptidyl aminopeptidase/acylaminoacyl peptidase
MLENYDVTRFYSFRQAVNPVFDASTDTFYFVSDASGKPQVWRMKGLGGFPEQFTFFEDNVSNLQARRSSLILQLDKEGSEEFKLVELESSGRPIPVKVEDKVIFRLGKCALNGAFSFACNRRNNAFFDSYVVNEKGEEFLAFKCDGTSQPQGFSYDSSKLLVTVANTNLDTSLYVVDLKTNFSKEVLHHRDETLVVEPQFGSDGVIYLCTNYNDEYLQPSALNPESGELHTLSEDRSDSDNIAVSVDGKVAYTRNKDGFSELHLTRSDGKEFFSRRLDGVVSELRFSTDGSKLFYVFSGYDVNPNIYCLFSDDSKIARLTYVSRGYYGGVVKPELTNFPSFDGLRIPVFVYIPRSQRPSCGYPSIVYVHGGPESQKRVDYDGQIQFFLNKGYAVLTPNVRGSTGYGKAYVHLDDVDKRLDSVKDLAWLVEWMKTDGRFDARRICVMGRSYGGYMVLASIAFYPDLWKCAVEAVGIANLETFLKNTSVWRRHLREAEYGALERDLETLRRVSPIHQVDKIKAPLLVQHGANDPRVPLSESLAIVEAIKTRGGVAELVLFQDEGHMNHSIKNRVAWAQRVSEFLEKHL